MSDPIWWRRLIATLDGDPYIHSAWLRKNRCGGCHGRGWIPGPDDYNGQGSDYDCDHCGGTGWRPHESAQACSRCIPVACGCWCHPRKRATPTPSGAPKEGG